MNLFLFRVMFFVKKGSFAAKITVERAKTYKNDQIFSLHIFLGSLFTRRPI